MLEGMSGEMQKVIRLQCAGDRDPKCSLQAVNDCMYVSIQRLRRQCSERMTQCFKVVPISSQHKLLACGFRQVTKRSGDKSAREELAADCPVICMNF